MRSSWKRWLSALLLGVTLMGTGCYGSMALTKKVYTWNGTITNGFARSVVFDAFWIVPIYEVSTLIDVVILNPIEFFTGSNPAGG